MIETYVISGGPKDGEEGKFQYPKHPEILGCIVRVDGHDFVCTDIDKQTNVATLKW